MIEYFFDFILSKIAYNLQNKIIKITLISNISSKSNINNLEYDIIIRKIIIKYKNPLWKKTELSPINFPKKYIILHLLERLLINNFLIFGLSILK